MNFSEEIYILYRRIKAAISWCVYFLCAAWPVQKNKIVFSCFEGGGYGCNPKYIAEEIIRRMEKEDEKYQLFWLVNDLTKELPKEIHKIKNNLWNRAFHLSTAEVWVDNARKNYGTRKRQGQLYIQTWHGQNSLKPVGKLRGVSFSKIARIVTRGDAKQIDYFLVDSQWSKNVFAQSFYGENFIVIGSPRCDVLLNHRDEKYREIRKKLKLPAQAKLLMYAPTFRGGSQSGVRDVFEHNITLSFERLLPALEQKFGGEWYVLLRLHPQLALKMTQMALKETDTKHFIDISYQDDMYEYLAATDVFISDYTSAEPEAAFIGIPVFIYADDLDKYIADRGSFLFDIYKELPYPIAKTNEELLANIKQFNLKDYHMMTRKFFEGLGILEDGRASGRVVDIIEEKMMQR